LQNKNLNSISSVESLGGINETSPPTSSIPQLKPGAELNPAVDAKKGFSFTDCLISLSSQFVKLASILKWMKNNWVLLSQMAMDLSCVLERKRKREITLKLLNSMIGLVASELNTMIRFGSLWLYTFEVDYTWHTKDIPFLSMYFIPFGLIVSVCV